MRKSIALTACAGLAVVLAACIPSPPNPVTVADEDVSIVHTPSGQQGDCVPASQAAANGTMTAAVEDRESDVVMTIDLAAPLCEPIEAKAAVYAMPTSGGSWPQRLSAVRPFTLQAAGTTVVTFVKGCDPVQFDVLTGETPDVIFNGVVNHGPLLFSTTAVMHFAEGDCVSPTTTVATPTTTTEAPTTTAVEATTTAAPTTTVAETTTTTAEVLSAQETTSTTAPVGVEAANVDRQPPSGVAVTDTGRPLAVTGADSAPVALIAALSLLLGGLLLAAQRRRRNALGS